MTDAVLDPRVLRRFDVGRQVGRGAYGVVWKAVRREDGATVALKKCFEAFRCDVDARRTYREVRYLQALAGHDNVVRLRDVLRAGNDRDLYLGAWRRPPRPRLARAGSGVPFLSRVDAPLTSRLDALPCGPRRQPSSTWRRISAR